MLRLGLLGKEISHSKSQKVYEDLLNDKIDYTLFDYASIQDIPPLDWFFQKVQGLSITSPYKKHFLNQIQNISEMESINCIKYENGNYLGTNTDYEAIKEIFPKLIKLKEFSEIILLGNGSMAEMSIHFFKNHNIIYKQYTRSADGPLEKLTFEREPLVINTCSRDFVFSGEIPTKAVFYDFNYDFDAHKNYLEPKVFQYIDGFELLKLQGFYALKFWKLSP